jgi:peptide/nickel transport system ATP-binding protein/oligopeptide transport system ATP-binding protein
MTAIPIADPKLKRKRLILKGDVPSPLRPPSGCRFHPRCPRVMEVCRGVKPPTIEHSPGHFVACYLYTEKK